MRAQEFAEAVRTLAGLGEPFAMATVVRTEGSTLAKRGFKLLVAHDGTIVAGTFGGGCPEGPIVAVAEETMRTGESRVVRVHLVDAPGSLAGMAKSTDPDEIFVETNCGGTLDVHVEPILPSERLVIVGQGGRDDVEEALVRFGRGLELEVVVVDPSPELTTSPDRLVNAAIPDPRALGLGRRDSVVVLTKGERDVAILETLASTPLRYVGLLASRRRAETDRTALRERGVDPGFVSTIRSPAGVEIGARSPSEIAVSILAEVISAKYGKTAAPRPPAP